MLLTVCGDRWHEYSKFWIKKCEVSQADGAGAKNQYSESLVINKQFIKYINKITIKWYIYINVNRFDFVCAHI